MASTNHTTNYNLPQYVGGDKPTYLGDFNTAMAAIDTQMKLNADNAAQAIGDSASAVSVANTANTTANTANSKADANTSSINTITGTTIPAVQSTANSALLQANTNATAITGLDTRVETLENTTSDLSTEIQRFNLTNFRQIQVSDVTVYGGGSCTGTALTLATNSDGSIFKLYGGINFSGNCSYATIQSSLRPDSAYKVNTAGIDNTFISRDFQVNTDGTITIYLETSGTIRVKFFPCLYFNKSFGDTGSDE